MNGAATSDVLLAIVSLVLATYVTRAGMLLVGNRLSLSRHVEAALRFAPTCALTALVLPEVLAPAGTFDLSLGNARWPAALASATFLLWRNNMLGGIAVGMTIYLVLVFGLRSSVFAGVVRRDRAPSASGRPRPPARRRKLLHRRSGAQRSRPRLENRCARTPPTGGPGRTSFPLATCAR